MIVSLRARLLRWTLPRCAFCLRAHVESRGDYCSDDCRLRAAESQAFGM